MRREGSPMRVLVVDDELLIRYGLSRFLKKRVVVKAVATAEEALDEIGSQHYDLCFLDVILPRMTGLEAMKIINDLSPNTKVAMMTGNRLDETIKRQIEDIVFAFIEKPFDLSGILEIVNRAAAFLIEQEPSEEMSGLN